MNSFDQQMEAIERYLAGEMAADEAEAFEADLAADPGLKRLFSIHKNIAVTVGDAQATALEQSLRELRDRPFSQTAKIAPLRKYWLLAAAALILALVALVFLLPEKPASTDQLFANYNQPAAISLKQMSDNNEALLVETEQFFNSKKYAEAAAAAEKYLTAKPEDYRVTLVAGIAQLQVGNHEQALNYFEKCVAAGALNAASARWWQALTYLKTGDLAACKNALQLLVDDADADFHAEAKELLEKLR